MSSFDICLKSPNMMAATNPQKIPGDIFTTRIFSMPLSLNQKSWGDKFNYSKLLSSV